MRSSLKTLTDHLHQAVVSFLQTTPSTLERSTAVLIPTQSVVFYTIFGGSLYRPSI
ncbi:hypothetical protein EMIT0P43_20402 [Pseudomonas jessenii]